MSTASPGVGLTGRPLAIVVTAIVVVAVATLALPIAITYDAWGWLVWGREVLHGSLDTTGGPSWKPLPVIATTVLAVFGGLTPTLWLLVARVAGLLALVITYRLASRWGGWVAGTVAAAALLLTPDDESGFLRLLFEGHIEVITVTLALWAVERHLDGRRAHALLLGGAVALSRPEAWPLLGLYVLWLWWHRGAPRWLITLVVVTIPVLWFGGDWWGSGDWWHGADVAQVGTADSGRRWEVALDRAAEMVPWPVWVATAAGIAAAVRARSRAQLTLGAIAVGWTAVVVVMCGVLRYAALGRFYLVAAAIACVGAGLGVRAALDVARAGTDSVRIRRGAAAFLVVLVACAAWCWPRVDVLQLFPDETTERARFEHDLDDAIAVAGGRDAVLGCGLVAAENTDLAIAARVALAWKLDAPMSKVWTGLGSYPGVYFARIGSTQDLRLAASSAADVVPLGTSAEWSVYAIGCPAATAP